MIRFRVRTPDTSARYEMPWTDAPVASLAGLPADMLDRATLYLQGYDPTPDAKWVGAFVHRRKPRRRSDDENS